MQKPTPVTRKKAPAQATDPVPEAKPRKRAPTRKAAPKPSVKPTATDFRYKFILISFEILGLLITAIMAIVILLGYSANQFSGTRLFSNLLPFAAGVLGLILLAAFLLIAWWKLRQYCQTKAHFLTPLLAVSLAAGIGWFCSQAIFTEALGHFRGLVGGKQEARRVTLSHQVYAAYRRYDQSQLQRIVTRAQEYHAVIAEAAKAFDLDINLLQGIAATESSFLPRDSQDGGHGLFQITLVPQEVLNTAGGLLKTSKLSLESPRHNAFIAAATFKHYLVQMHNDLFLGLLAYNIGPKNGGLRFIMQQYGATDFITIQPYLQQLPRDYPIRVLSYALAFRLWQREGKLLTYEEGKNALHIQSIGVPGLETEL